MKKWIALLVLCLAAACCAPVPLSPRDYISMTEAVTVAVLQEEHPTGSDKWHPLCAGVWVDVDWVLTANHCTVDDQGDEPAPLAQIRYLASRGDRAPRTADVAYRDEDHDLALLRAQAPPAHAIAGVALESPPPGARVHVVGHPLGFLWTYLAGVVAAPPRWDPRFGPRVPLLQVQAPVTFGNSGGGCFDDRERLVGIADLTVHDLPNQGFFQPAETIRAFLTRSHVL